jgi:hypothetical protein
MTLLILVSKQVISCWFLFNRKAFGPGLFLDRPYVSRHETTVLFQVKYTN